VMGWPVAVFRSFRGSRFEAGQRELPLHDHLAVILICSICAIRDPFLVNHQEPPITRIRQISVRRHLWLFS
jgi:hypothetical protein